MKQPHRLFSFKRARTAMLYTPVNSTQPMQIGFAGFVSSTNVLDTAPAKKGEVA